MDYMTKERVYATVRGVIGIIAYFAPQVGIAFDVEMIATLATEAICLAALGVAWYWKNNNWTKPAIEAQEYKDVVLSGDDGYPYEIEEPEEDETEEEE